MELTMRTARALLAMVALTAVIGWSTAATATPGVEFQIDVLVGWNPPGTCSDGDNTAPNCLGFAGVGGFAGTATRLNWDNTTAAVDSYLGIGATPGTVPFPANVGDVGSIPTGSGTTSVFSEGAAVQTAQIRHTNNEIPDEDDDLASIVLSTSLVLRSGATVLVNLPLDITVNFQETTNEAPCANPPGNPLGSICDDVFTFIDVSADIPFQFDAGNGLETFVLHVRGLVDANGDSACTPFNGQVRCFTEEFDVTDRFVIAFVTQQQVPAPAALLLLGMGLVGMVAIRKRLSA
jgi:hypothetical protein